MLPFNIAHYAIMAKLVGTLSNIVPIVLEGDLSNVHIYSQHKEAVDKQLKNSISEFGPAYFSFSKSFFDDYEKSESLESFLNNFKAEYIQIENYKSFEKIPAKMIAPKK